MNALTKVTKGSSWAVFCAIAALLAACASMGGNNVKVTLSGDQEVPPATTSASGSGTITIAQDKSVSGSIKTTCADCTVAHIHVGAAGKNGPVIIPLTKTGSGEFTVPEGAKLTDAQYDSFKAGELYVNAHSAKYKGGEIRGQLKP